MPANNRNTDFSRINSKHFSLKKAAKTKSESPRVIKDEKLHNSIVCKYVKAVSEKTLKIKFP
jgi:hypothetical protein